MIQAGSEITIPAGNLLLKGNLNLPENPQAIIIFSHGSGSSRFSPRNRYVASELNRHGFATLLIDLLTPEEDEDYGLRFNIDLLTSRLKAVTRYIHQAQDTASLPIGYFGASTGAASALMAAADLRELIGAVVSRGGRPDLAASCLQDVLSPVLLIVGSLDEPVISLNEDAYKQMPGKKEIVIVAGATHLFEEPGKLEEVARLAGKWFLRFLVKNNS